MSFSGCSGSRPSCSISRTINVPPATAAGMNKRFTKGNEKKKPNSSPQTKHSQKMSANEFQSRPGTVAAVCQWPVCEIDGKNTIVKKMPKTT